MMLPHLLGGFCVQTYLPAAELYGLWVIINPEGYMNPLYTIYIMFPPQRGYKYPLMAGLMAGEG
jgi:hypothetical protein